MSNRTIGFIGGGRVARIFLEGWNRANMLPSNIVVSDCSVEALGKLKIRWPAVQTTADSRAAAGQDVVFLAVHPPAVAEVAAAIKGGIKPGALVVSLAPKFTIAKLSELLGGFARLARVIPNAPSVIGAGFNPVAFAPVLTVAEKAELSALLAPLGESPEVAEAKLEAYAVLTAMGPTYLWFQLQALREVAAGFGLSDAEITPALKRMVCGGARTLLESGLTPAEVMDLIPVKPLAEMEAQVAEMYRSRLPALHQKIKP
ncbi:MAG TPA: NAD(P)-binding domain-containing protein [Candidatus Paceibacterota bacterium]|nr:NAD(P)-binding domain-containing protein [Verrucomicrobiota bacterium]HOX04207.1 NAD(P)-binding domain-containing protein [Verrucomicrobiota bacterium]HRZ47163.1 NAD(P)-binding domain-containing protein [Candidatus Paceibacterota bacterium]HRZ94573.1 NAD(P)-binding domain-containing protein [Candidatus Paceibacterota bacterium]